MLAFFKHIFGGGNARVQKERLSNQKANREALAEQKKELLSKLANSTVSQSAQRLGSARYGNQRIEKLNEDWKTKMSSFETAFRIDS